MLLEANIQTKTYNKNFITSSNLFVLAQQKCYNKFEIGYHKTLLNP